MSSGQQSGAFLPAMIEADIKQLQTILTEFFSKVSAKDWDRPTEKNGWTLRQTLAHLSASGTLFYQAIECALADEPFTLNGLNGRGDLASFNDQQIALRDNVPPQALIDELLRALDATATCARSVKAEQFGQEISVLAYNRPLSVAELLGGQLSHPGIVHASQLARAISAEPLWYHYSKDFLQRQITRTFVLMSHSYWPERGGNLVAALNFHVHNFGTWHLTMTPQGGSYGEGLVERPAITFWLKDEHQMCRFFTLELSPMWALITGKMLVWGNVPLGLRLPSLFMPT